MTNINGYTQPLYICLPWAKSDANTNANTNSSTNIIPNKHANANTN